MLPRIPTRLAGALLTAAIAAACVRPQPPVEVPVTVRQADTVELLVASTTDVHARVRGWDYYANAADTLRGLARASTVVDSLRGEHPGRVILVDAGDIIQGNPLGYASARLDTIAENPVIAAMNAMRYDAAALGNHEFNYGLPHLERAIRIAQFPLLATNAYRPNGERYFRGTTIVERGGARVAIVGATTPGSMVWDRDNLAGRLEVRDIVPEVRRAVDSVRALGVDVVVVTVHSGLGEPSSYDTVSTGLASENVTARIAQEVPGIDLIVFGHSHRTVADSTINGVLVMQPRNWATSVGVAHLTLARAGDRWTVVRKRGELVPVVGRREDPRVLAATQRMHDLAVRYVTDSIGTTSVAWQADSARVKDTPIIDFILEVQRRAAGADLASTAAFSLDASLDAGAITVAEVARLYQYDNTLRAVRISGRQLREYLEFSARYFGQHGTNQPAVDPKIPGYNFDIVAGVDYTIDVSRPIGSRITRLTRKGRPVAPTDSFTMALNNYRQTGGGGYAMLAGAPVVYDKQEEIRQLLIDEVRRRGTIRPADYFTQNWRLVPQAAVGPIMTAIRGNPFERGITNPGTTTSRAGGRTLRVISTNDFHGGFESRADASGRQVGGAARMAALIERARAECRPPQCVSVLLDGGDMFQGTPASNLTHGRSVLELFHLLRYDAAAVGNHEFDWGQDTLRARIRDARYAILGANVRYTDGRDVEWLRDTVTIVRDGLRVGVIGIASPDTPDDSRPENVQGLRFLDPVPVIDSMAAALRRNGADAVVVTAHWGLFCRANQEPRCRGEVVDMAERLTAKVDAIVTGHTHSVVSTKVKGIPVVQASSSGRAVGVVDVPLGGGEAPMPIVMNVVDTVTASPRADSVVQRALARVASVVERRIATFATPLSRRGGDQTLGNVVTAAQRAAGSADLAATNVSGLRVDAIPAGPATWGALYQLHPFGNTLVRVTLSGAQLKEWLERQVRGGAPRVFLGGATVSVDTTRAVGDRIVSVTFADGRTLRADGTYTLVMNDFMSTNEGYGPPAGTKIEPLGITDLDALIEWAQAQPQPIAASEQASFRIVR